MMLITLGDNRDETAQCNQVIEQLQKEIKKRASKLSNKLIE